MSDLQHSFSQYSEKGCGNSASASPTNSKVPSINIGGLPASPGSPMNDLLGRSVDIKKQLLQSFHGHSSSFSGGVSGGGVTKPKLRRNSAYHVKSEDADLGDNGVGNGAEEGKEDQGIERKRRDNINEKIQELLTLIPSEYFLEKEQPAAGSTGAANHAFEEALSKLAGTRDGKPNKGQILTQAVEYIQTLQNTIDENNRKEVELFLKMKTLEKQQKGDKSSLANVPIAVEPTSAERALGEIGVGPESDGYFRKVLLESLNGGYSDQ
ncbi:hypothetical protein HF325_000148 [Metschnikowia pulcherrima]|uniref:BHLH domain-containing protein n=1 Tax=Metschnikowia pulcherrima TaxID=27326 RepID=A0A8H7LC60_9ASCO|nr:hypothetical protein HF325_000148 [Metschnikowia pulcherrima]